MSTTPSLRFVSWNLGACVLSGSGPSPDPEPGFEHVRQCLGNLRPDVAGLQEVLMTDGQPSQAARLAEQLGYPHLEQRALSPSHLVPGSEIGLAILSRFPLEDVYFHLFPNPGARNSDGETSHDKGLLACTVRHPELSFHFLCSHFLPFHRFGLSLDSSAAREILRRADELLASFGDLPLVCSVDFNARMGVEHLPRALGSGLLRSLINQPTRPGGQHHDQLLCSAGFSVSGARVYCSSLDHYIALAELSAADGERSRDGGFRGGGESTKIVHLSDLHFGERSAEDVDWKTFISTAEHETRRDRLISFLGAAANDADYVIVSGDLTIAGRDDGFETALETLTRLSETEGLPPLDRWVVVPGNHDVQRVDGSTGAEKDAKKRWDPFLHHFGQRCVRPWMPSHDPGMEATLADAEASLDESSPLWGGFARRSASTGAPQRAAPFPFLFDRARKVLIYAFNSASVSGSRAVIPRRVREAASFVRRWESPDADKARTVLAAFEEELSIDPARIQPGESALFQRLMRALARRAGRELDEALKIAVLHHHVVPLPVEEVKKFEFLTNAGGFLQDLSEEGFHVCLHGHKHFPAVRPATAPLDRRPLLVISGGTVGGGEAQGKAPGFFLLDYQPPTRTLAASFVELKPRGNPEKLVAGAPVVARVRADEGGGFSEPPASRPSLQLREKLDACERALLRFFRSASGEGGLELRGWSHSLDENRVSTIATGFGLRILRLTGASSPTVRSAAAEAVRTLLALRNPEDGGWSASSQMTENSQPEPTAFVLLGLRHWLSPREMAEPVSALESLVDDEGFRGRGIHTFSLALLIRTLSEVAPDSARLEPLVRLLLGAAYLDGEGRPVSWPSYSAIRADHALGPAGSVPTVVHSAMAVLALRVVNLRTGGRLGRGAAELSAAARWLLEQPEWPHVTEDINRRLGRRYCSLVVKHFTSTWVLRALLATSTPPDRPRVLQEIRSLAESEQEGLWNWGAVPRPIWATHDALSTLRAFALRRAAV